ncbi:WD40-repeat-containing domain protein [Armillaria luteobubalina]|uniref:methylated diphthine methylhydrolase n=1 Tax=Armillaria luteobubalina TaxID=153913 RepID=A0AA39UWK2_9AGAR|nr:WD40-repeat-containing domain protein [Armillaria luteobubalina]
MFDTIYPADSVEFCPHDSLQDIFVVGTYKLDQDDGDMERKTPQHRRGQCRVFRMDTGTNFEQIQCFDLPAVLDMKWCHMSPSSPATLGIADSEGNITLHQWQETGLRQIQGIQIAKSSEILCLSLDWSNRRTPATQLGSLVVSLSDGSLSILRPDNGTGSLSVQSSWHAHDYEPWIAAWNYWDTNMVFSGGDDLQMKGWDVREDLSKPIFVNKRFDAGITSIQSHPYIENLIAVGSYDNLVRLFDIRKPSIPISQIDVGGGAWRVKWHPSSTRKNDLLVACMHDGFKIVSFDHLLSDDFLRANAGNGKIVKRFDEHESLAYGVDWSYATSEGDQTAIASCSFYDHLLHTWSG